MFFTQNPLRCYSSCQHFTVKYLFKTLSSRGFDYVQEYTVLLKATAVITDTAVEQNALHFI